MKLNETQTNSVFTCLINGLKGSNKKNRGLYAISIGFLLMKLNKKQLDDVFECLNGLKDENECIRALCAKSFGIIATKTSEKQLEKVINALISGLKGGYNNVRESCAESLGVISEKLNEKQLKNAIHTLIDGFKDKDKNTRESCAKSLGVILKNLTDKQLEGVFNSLPNELEYFYFDSYFKAKEISTKLNDKRLYLLVIHLLERAKKEREWSTLSKISEDMWKRATIGGLKEHMQ
ncbi:hypothetical protein RFI_39895, partial [Reticulomyxa filosa]